MQALMIRYLISHVLTYIEKGIDWNSLEARLEAKINDTFHSKALANGLDAIVDEVFVALKMILHKEENLKSILVLLSEEKYDDALTAVEKMLISLVPTLAVV